ncbi:hypothetical protein X754_28100 [Mesorhizobium sp. LNJC403B00]|nr:hypothetical protein X754_28100 [Mesorhizobium sp. LNJC403B00]
MIVPMSLGALGNAWHAVQARTEAGWRARGREQETLAVFAARVGENHAAL